MREDLFNNVVAKANNVFPGLYTTLELYCRTRYNFSVLEALISNPQLIVNVLVEMYSNMDVARFIIRELLVKPIVTASSTRVRVDELVNLLFENPDEFKKTMETLIDPA